MISEKTSDQMRKLMRLVVEYGTAKFAEAPGYVVGGKTGTAEKNEHGRYEEKKLLSSFIGAFPMNDPQYVMLTLVDEPHGNKKATAMRPPDGRSPRRPAGSSSASRRCSASRRSTKIRPKSSRPCRSEASQAKRLKITELLDLDAAPITASPHDPRGRAAAKSGDHRTYCRFAPGSARLSVRRA